MLVLFETSTGYAVFKLLDDKKLKNVDNLYKCFETPEQAKKVVQLKMFKEFKDTTEALASSTALIESKMCKTLKKLLKSMHSEGIHEELAIQDAKLGALIKDKFDIKCVTDKKIQELIRYVRSQAPGLLNVDTTHTNLGLGHSLGRYKIKFNPDKVDVMVIQAVSSLDDIDREINNYVMRAKEWYGWHFPELVEVIPDNQTYIRTVQKLGMKSNANDCDLSDIIPEEIEQEVRNRADLSIGCDIDEQDISQITLWCDQVLMLMEQRVEIFDYVTNRMRALSPNLSAILGEVPAARILAKSSSLTEMAKKPASTLQILGAEKALFKALKTKHDTPKYGLIFNSELVQQANQKHKGKMARSVAAKAALATRIDALGDSSNVEVGIQARAHLEKKMKSWNEGLARKLAGSGNAKSKFDKYENKSYFAGGDSHGDSTLGKKRKAKDDDEEFPAQKKAKKN